MDLFHKLPEFAQSALVTQRIRAFFEEKGQGALSLSIVRVILRKQTCTIVLSQAVARTEMRLHIESIQKLLWDIHPDHSYTIRITLWNK